MLPKYITKIEEEKEYFENGNLKYECYWGVIIDGYKHLFPERRRFGTDGKWRVRLKYAAKYKKSGELEWKHIYDEFGRIREAINIFGHYYYDEDKEVIKII